MKFINRDKELSCLTELYNSNSAELVVIYGRRRVGKTRLLAEFAKDKKCVFFSPPRTSGKEALEIFSERIVRSLPEMRLEHAHFSSFRKAFEFLISEAKTIPIVLIMDEFPYLLEAEVGVDSHIQHLWDHQRRESKIKIIVSGSTLSVMQKKVMGKNAPLYGRRTGSIHVKPFDFFSMKMFMPATSIEMAIYYYSIFGGIPFYIEQLQEKKTLLENICSTTLVPNGLLYNEPYFLVQEELRDPKLYFAVMHSIASGNTRPTAIANYVGIDSNKIGKYINVLLKLELIAREIPITIKPSARSTKGYYRINDHFLRFWFRYVYPNTASIELGQGEELWKKVIEPDMPTFIGHVWEEICRQYLVRSGGRRFGFTQRVMNIGRYWESDVEIDIIAENKPAKEVLFCECKWGKGVNVERILDELRIKADSIAEYRGFKKHFGIFTRGKATNIAHHVSLDELQTA